MPPASSARLGPYEILNPIGAGGMGEAYKARDTRLDRIVAIKQSKEAFSERFEREARTNRVAYTRDDKDRQFQTWISSVSGGPPVRLTNDKDLVEHGSNDFFGRFEEALRYPCRSGPMYLIFARHRDQRREDHWRYRQRFYTCELQQPGYTAEPVSGWQKHSVSGDQAKQQSLGAGGIRSTWLARSIPGRIEPRYDGLLTIKRASRRCFDRLTTATAQPI
jgi:hypothetical protein